MHTGTPRPTGSGVSIPRERYSRPQLRVYGSVSELTMSGLLSSSDGTSMMMVLCERGSKQDIVRVGDHPLGIGVYLFTYRAEHRDRHGHGRFLGVMADEVERVLPAAVVRHPDGYRMVDYAVLGSAVPRR
jgi:hypothetical protein